MEFCSMSVAIWMGGEFGYMFMYGGVVHLKL